MRDLAERRLPEGTVTLLLADVEGSTLLWERDSSAARPAMSKLDAIADEVIAACGGARPVEQGEGDSFVAGFARASDAVACALQLQLRLEETPLRVRMGLHTGEVDVRDGQRYDGPTIIRAARLRDLGHGGQVLVSNLTREATVDSLPEGAEMLDLGPQVLKGIDRPERVFQLVHPGLRREFPSLRSAQKQSNLPAQLTPLVGRAQEIDEVSRLLVGQRLVMLMGAGGCGKTRLAIEVAARMQSEFPGGVWFCDLGPLADAGPVPSALCAAVGARSQATDQTDAACVHLGDSRALVVLDNCEHLIDVCASLAESVLRRCPNVAVLATSREPLGVPGEVTWRVPSLASPDIGERLTVDDVASFDAVRLFVQHARQVRPQFELTRANAAPIAEICARLDGIPLAIELAAARVRTLSVAQIASGLTDRFRMLGRGARTALPRQQTLEASVAWSYELLSDEQRATLRRLSVFTGGFTLEAAEDVVAGGDVEGTEVLELLTQLVDRSLVIAEETSGESRYRLLETIRHYARERLIASREVADTARRHLKWFERWTRLRAGMVWRGTADRTAVALEFDRDYENLRAAVEWAIADGTPREGLRLTEVLINSWTLIAPAGRMREFRQWLEMLLETPGEIDVRTRAASVTAIAGASMFLAEGEMALERGREGIILAQESGDVVTETWARSIVFQLLMAADSPEAEEALEDAIAHARNAGLHSAVTSHLTHHAMYAFSRGELQRAMSLLEEVAQSGHEPPGQIRNGRLRTMGVIRCLWGDLPGGLAFCQQAWEEVLATHNEYSYGSHVISTIGLIEMLLGNDARAQAALELGLDLAAASGFAHVHSETGAMLAFFHATRGRADDAMPILRALPPEGEVMFAARRLDIVKALDSIAAGDVAGAREVDLGPSRVPPPFVDVISRDSVRAVVARAVGELIEAESLVVDLFATILRTEAILAAPEALEIAAALRADAGAHTDAVRLFGAAASGRVRMGTVATLDRFFHPDVIRERLRSELGPQAFEAAWDEGAAMSLEGAVAYAMRGRGSRQRPASGWDSLTPTERRVVDLVAEGLTNKQVGEKLFISARTVSTHLSHVFGKLGVSSRSELTAEATKRKAST